MSTTGWVWTIIIIIIIVLGGWYVYSTMGSTAAAPATTTTTTTDTSGGTTGTATSGTVFMAANDATKGTYMADPSGRTLYTYDKDTAGVSNCSGACAAAWPPYAGAVGATMPNGISVITRSDGSQQFAYNGKPLYYYASDTGPNMINGDGVGGVWHIIKL